MDFTYALNALKEGQKVSRSGWNGKGMYLILRQGIPVNGHLNPANPKDPLSTCCPDGTPNIPQGKPGQMLPFIVMKVAGDSQSWGEGYSDYVSWLASQTDLLAEDWGIVEDIKQAPKRNLDGDAPEMELPRYDCHKVVHAAKITELKVVPPPGPNEESAEPGAMTLVFGEVGGYKTVSGKWIERFKPEVGGYFVVYEDRYTSFSPAKAFEDGYTRSSY